jgi:hypothetical protein
VNIERYSFFWDTSVVSGTTNIKISMQLQTFAKDEVRMIRLSVPSIMLSSDTLARLSTVASRKYTVLKPRRIFRDDYDVVEKRWRRLPRPISINYIRGNSI